jgi:hypothetical protein
MKVAVGIGRFRRFKLQSYFAGVAENRELALGLILNM